MEFKQENIIAGAFIGAAIVITVLLLMPKVDRWLEIKQEQVTNQAIESCGLSANVVWEDAENGAQVTEPYDPAYQECLRDKGIK